MAVFIDISNRYTKKVGCKMKTVELLQILNNMTPMDLLTNAGMDNKFPVDIVSLIRNLGIKLIPYDFTEMEQREEIHKDVLRNGYILGAVAATEDNIGIFYKNDDSPNRIRFTLAHELAHCCLHMNTDNFVSHVDYRRNEHATSGIEFDANVFAGELLMPENALRYAQQNLVAPYLSSLAKIFMVSTTVMKARLDYLHLEYIKD